MSLAGKWRITEMDSWDREAIDLVGPAFIEFGKGRSGSFRFIAVDGWMDCRTSNAGAGPTSSSLGTATTTAIPPAGADGRSSGRMDP